MKGQSLTMPIYGLACGGGGALTIEHALERLPGVVRVYVNPLMEMAYVEIEPHEVTPAQLMSAVREAGFRAGAPTLR